MPKKKINNRLNKLFENIKSDEPSAQPKRAIKRLFQTARLNPDSVPVDLVQPRAPDEVIQSAPASSVQRSDAAVLSLAFQSRENDWATLRILDETTNKRTWSEDDQLLVRQVADQLTLALENARLFQRQQSQTAELQSVSEISSAVTSILELQTLLENFVDLTRQRFDLYHAHIFILEENHRALTVKACGWKDKSLHGTQETRTIDIDQPVSIVARAARTLQPVILNNVREEPTWLLNPSLPDVQSEMAIPVLAQEKLIGILNIHADRLNAFDENDAAIMTTLAAQVGTAIQNTRLFQEAQQERQQLRTLIDNLPDTIFVKDSKSRFLVANQTLARWQVGVESPEDLVGKSDYDFFSKDLADLYYKDDQTVIHSGEALLNRVEPSSDSDGNQTWLSTSKIPLRDNRGQVIGLVGIARDITAQKQAEIERERLLADVERHAIQLQAAADVSRATSSLLHFDELIQQTVNIVRDRFNLYYVGLFLLDEEHKFAVLRAGTGEAGQKMVSQNHQLKVGEASMIGQCIVKQQALIAQDVGQEAVRFNNPLLPDTHAELALPLVSRGEVIGAMSVQSDRQAAFTEDDLTVLQTMADQIATSLQNTFLFQKTQVSEAELRSLFSAMRDVIIVYDKDGRYIRIAPTNPSRLFIPSQDMIGKTIKEVLPQYLHEPMMSAIQETLKTGLPVQLEYWLDIDDQTYWFDGSFSRLSEDQVFLVSKDISERKKTEELIRRRNEYLATSSDIGRKITSTLELETIYSSVVTLVTERFSLHHTAIFTIEEAGLNAVLRDSTGTIGQELKKQKYKLPIRTDTLVGKVMATGEVVINNDIAKDELLLLSYSYASAGEDVIARPKHLLPETLSEAGIPLRVGSRVTGVLDLQAELPNAFHPDDIAVLQTLADQIAIAIDNARSYEELAILNELNNELTKFMSIDDISETVFKYTSQLMGTGSFFISLMNDDKQEVSYPLSFEDGERMEAPSRKPGNGLSDYVIRTNQPLFMPDRVTERMQELGIDTLTAETSALAKCWLGAPMSISNRAFGAVAVQSKDQEHLYTEHQRDLLVTIGQQAAIALENSRLYELSQASQANFRRRNEYLATSSDIGRNITSTLDLETIFSRAVNLIAERFSLHHTAIYTIEETGFNTILRDGTGAIGQELKMEKYKLPIKTDTLVGKVIAAGEAMIDNDISKDELLLLTYAYASGGRDAIFRPKHLLPETFSEAAIPLHVGSRVTGVLDLQSNRPDAFHPDDIAVLQTLADQIAIAIDNARSYELSQQAVREMSELDRLKNQFLANMSHELRTPLNSIIGFSRVIIKGIDGPVTELQQQDLTAIYNSGQHLLALINDILDLAKIEAGKMELAFDEVNMSDVINSVIATVTGLIKDKSVTIIKNIAPNMPTVRADAIRIRQVLINLFSNASKFTDEGTITVAASVKAGENNRPEIIVSVTDTGPGITPEDQVKLFQAFSQVDNSPTRKTGGTGLGLSISQNLIQMHGGQIGVESVVGKGSTFYFTLPSYRGNPSPNEAQSNISGKIILAIDDDPQVISLYERYLQPQGYQVVAVTDPSKAKERAIQLKPFAITLDIMMPGIDGWQVLNELKSSPETRSIPVVICSIIEDHEKGFSLGAADYLAKPILEEDLLNALNGLNKDNSIEEILVIDDNPNDLLLIGKMLTDQRHYKPTLVEGGINGWDAITKKTPQAVILDLFMPVLDGFTILENMRADPRLRDIPVIILTAGDLTADQKTQLAEFGPRLIAKSTLNEKDLITSIEHALQRAAK
jgi:PAS domain S-box-containing protein